ncbi:hypothetical protein PHISCL_04237 [Aspergillus sclerotialis]|uniref:Uncharacterized protein n=1 Tax=Aspergillus sclerotialis TaxID=2070753 RepID=A0A3A2ZJN9_9EURO|nr:hypothetical protein PHISCL_04237 [Aspergillus sclerotialis]
MSLAEGNTRAFVQALNKLPRPKTTPSGFPNCWHFTIKTLPMNPPDDLDFLVHLPSGQSIEEGRTKIHTLPSPVAKAKVITPLLLEAFVASLATGAHGETIPGVSAFVPWEWSTRDKKLAKALEKRLKELGVRNELCTVHVATERDEILASDVWQSWKSSLLGQMTGDPVMQAMMSQDNAAPDVRPPGTVIGSEAADWKEHKKSCRNVNEGSAGKNNLDSFEYYRSVARTNPKAQELGRSLNLTIGTHGETLYHPIRRLVVTGNDTDENLELFFGPNWKQLAGPVHKDARMEVLLQPSPGETGYELYSRWDKGTPTWSPRPATNDELVQMEKATRMLDGFNAMRP